MRYWPGTVQEITDEQQRMLDLSNRCKRVDAFEYEGVKYVGDFIAAVKNFCAETTYPSDFHVWLQNNYKQIL